MAEKAERKAKAEAVKAGKGEKAPKGKPESAPAPRCLVSPRDSGNATGARSSRP